MRRRSTLAGALPMLLSIGLAIGIHNSFGITRQEIFRGVSAEQSKNIKLIVSTDGSSSGFFSSPQEPDKRRFKIGDKIQIGITMTNTADNPIKVCAFSNPYYQNRPELLKDGQPVPYLQKISELVRQSDNGECEVARVPDVVELKPNEPLRVPSLDLESWYGSLGEGHYEFVLRRTFSCCYDAVVLAKSNAVSFNVTP